MVSNRQLFLDTKQVIVPPVDHFLNVEVKPDRAQYQPQEEGLLNVTARDRDGKPVSAEIALGLIDASVFYIQQVSSGDPRQFYFGTKRTLRSQIQSTFQQKVYGKLVEDADKQLVDEKVLREAALGDNDESFSRLQNISELERRSDGSVGDSYKAEFGAAKSKESVQVSDLPINGRTVDSVAMLAPATAGAPPPAQEPAVQVRSDFRSTVFWQPDVTTDANGVATIKVKYPDSLTSWTATARVITAGDKFGIASADTRTKKPLIVRLEAPRFFVAGDKATVSAVINNNNDQPMSVTPSLDVEGATVSSLLHHGRPANAKAAVTVPGNGEQRVDWEVTV